MLRGMYVALISLGICLDGCGSGNPGFHVSGVVVDSGTDGAGTIPEADQPSLIDQRCVRFKGAVCSYKCDRYWDELSADCPDPAPDCELVFLDPPCSDCGWRYCCPTSLSYEGCSP